MLGKMQVDILEICPIQANRLLKNNQHPGTVQGFL
jgi:hypothetical protein